MIGHFIITEVEIGVILCQFLEETCKNGAKIDRFMFPL